MIAKLYSETVFLLLTTLYVILNESYGILLITGLKGTVLGLYGMLQGIGLLFSSLIAGIMWDRINSGTPFILGGVIGILSAIIITVILGKNTIMKLFWKNINKNYV